MVWREALANGVCKDLAQAAECIHITFVPAPFANATTFPTRDGVSVGTTSQATFPWEQETIQVQAQGEEALESLALCTVHAGVD